MDISPLDVLGRGVPAIVEARLVEIIETTSSAEMYGITASNSHCPARSSIFHLPGIDGWAG